MKCILISVYGVGVFAVKMGADVFEVGRLPDEYLAHRNRLEGRLAQIWSVHGKSRTRRKLQKDATHDGLCTARIIDRYEKGDEEYDQNLDAYLIDRSAET